MGSKKLECGVKREELLQSSEKAWHTRGRAGGFRGPGVGMCLDLGMCSSCSARRRGDPQQTPSINTRHRGSGAGRRCPTAQIWEHGRGSSPIQGAPAAQSESDPLCQAVTECQRHCTQQQSSAQLPAARLCPGQEQRWQLSFPCLCPAGSPAPCHAHQADMMLSP